MNKPALKNDTSQKNQALKRLEQIFARRSSKTQYELNTNDESADVQSRYTGRVEHDIDVTRELIAQADIGIKKLSAKLSKNREDEVVKLKKLVIAYKEANLKLCFVPEKGDVIGIASTSTLIEELVKQQKEAVDAIEMKSSDIEDTIQKQVLIKQDYELVKKYIQECCLQNERIEENIDNSIAELGQKPLTYSTILESVDKKIKETYMFEEYVLNYLKRVIVKYLALSDWQSQRTLAEKELQAEINRLLNLVDGLANTLLHDVSGGTNRNWVNIEPTKVEHDFIRHLLINDLIETNNLDSGSGSSSSSSYSIRLREFGFDY